MKPDEQLLWESFGEETPNRTPRDAAIALGTMAPKRLRYLCEKWADQGIYGYGVSCDLGWKNEESK
jgi:hypothetical protein